MTNNKSYIIHEAYRQSEKNLEYEISLGIAADQRAMAFCGWMVGAAALLTGLASGSANNRGALYIGAFFLIFSAALAGFSARPIQMRAPGAKFSDMEKDIKDDVPLDEVLVEMGSHNDKDSLKNRKKLAFNGKVILASYLVAIVGLSIPIFSKMPTLISWICGDLT